MNTNVKSENVCGYLVEKMKSFLTSLDLVQQDQSDFVTYGLIHDLEETLYMSGFIDKELHEKLKSKIQSLQNKKCQSMMWQKWQG